MTDTPNRPPLWQVMTQARYNSEGARLASIRHATAAEIRALRDWLVPEEPEPKMYHPNGEHTLAWCEWNSRQRLRALLTAEADRAERGDG